MGTPDYIKKKKFCCAIAMAMPNYINNQHIYGRSQSEKQKEKTLQKVTTKPNVTDGRLPQLLVLDHKLGVAEVVFF